MPTNALLMDDNILRISSGIQRTRAPTIPSKNPTNSKRWGNFQYLAASNTTRKTLLSSTKAETGPAGPFEYAFYMQALPTESKMEPKNPITNSLLLNTSWDCQNQVTPRIIIRVLLKKEVAKLIVMASKPTLADVRCLIKRPEVTKKTGVRSPNKTATHLGTLGSNEMLSILVS